MSEANRSEPCELCGQHDATADACGHEVCDFCHDVISDIVDGLFKASDKPRLVEELKAYQKVIGS